MGNAEYMGTVAVRQSQDEELACPSTGC